jgi:hypothetical protein
MKRLLFINLLLLAGGLSAQTVYKWVDENGDVHYSQTLPPEQTEKAHERLTDEGLLAERIDRVMTAEEREQLETAQELEQEEAARVRLQQQQDRLFLATFPTEADLESSFESRRENVLAERRSVESLIDQARSRFSERVEQAAALERQGDPVPEHLVERITESRASLRELNRRLESIDQRLDDLEAERMEELARHRQLTRSG